MKSMLSLPILLMLLVACTPPTASQLQPSPTTQVASSPVPADSSAASASSAVDEPGYNAPAWANLPLTDARTGESFTLADYAGKTVFVEPMATWCTNCRRQLPNAEAARQQLDPDQFVFIGLSVAENIDNATLAQYVEAQGWNFRFAVASAELTQGMIDSFGRTVVTPPSTPHFIIRPDGSLTEIQTGSHSAEDLIAELEGAANG
jgi:thiol-disulfide isomerase/thioredoxin